MVVVFKQPNFKASNHERSGSETMSQEYVGNCKEFRVRVNEKRLKIVGNNNKIVIDENSGKLDVVGNMNKIKILKNSGKISYIGNNGKVYLGRESTEKVVDYIGNNGILKFFNDVEFCCGNRVRTSVNSSWTSKSTSVSSSSSSSSSSESDGEKSTKIPSDSKESKSSKQFHKKKNCSTSKKDQFANISIHNNISLPNLNAISSQHIRIRNSVNVTGSTGNIVVNNFYST